MMILKNKLSRITFSALTALFAANSLYADSLSGGNNIREYELTWVCSACSATTASITTTGFSPFLALEEGGVITQVSNSSSLVFFGTGFTGASQSIYVSQASNFTTVGSSGTAGYSMTGPAIPAGSEVFNLSFAGFDVPTFVVLDHFAGQSFVVAAAISPHDQQRAEASIETINENVLRSKVNHVRNTYTHQITRLKRSGGFSLVGADYAETGLNAGGDIATGIGVWFAPAYTSLKNTTAISNSSNFTGSQESYLLGMDIVLNPKLLLGGLVGYEASDTDSSDNSKTDADGYVVSAYAAYNFDSGFTGYGHIGFNSANTDIEDRTIFGASGSFDGDYDSDSYFLGFGVMRTSELENGLHFTMDLGYNYAHTDSDSYTAIYSAAPSLTNRMKVKSITVSEFLLNMELAQPESWGEYYGALGAALNVSENDDDFYDEGNLGLNAGVGVRFNASKALLGEVSYNKMFLNKGHNDYTFNANLRYEF